MNHRIPFVLIVAMLALVSMGVGCDVLQSLPLPGRAPASIAATAVPAVQMTATVPLVPTATTAPPTSAPAATIARTATPAPTATATRPAPISSPVSAAPTPTLVPPPPVPVAPSPKGTRQVNLIVVQGYYPIAGRTVWMVYFDENIRNWMTTSRATDSNGTAVFQVPTSDSGESFFFTFGGSDTELPELTAAISGGRWSAFKIPAAPAQTEATLQMDPSRMSIQVIQGQVNIKTMK